MGLLAPTAALLLFLSCYAFAGAVYLQSGLYATRGQYDDGHSNDGSAYATVNWNLRQYLTVGYDRLLIRRGNWDYTQQIGIAGTSLSSGRWGLRCAAGRIDGDYSDSSFAYADHTELFSGEVLWMRWDYGAGLGSVRTTSFGATRVSTNQFTGRLYSTLSPVIWLTIRPTYDWVSDGRRLSSLLSHLDYAPRPNVMIRADAMIGQRMYYFDNDLLTIFNQIETQEGLFSAQVDWWATKRLMLMGKWIRTSFDEYDITYYVAGLKCVLQVR